MENLPPKTVPHSAGVRQIMLHGRRKAVEKQSRIVDEEVVPEHPEAILDGVHHISLIAPVADAEYVLVDGQPIELWEESA